MPKQCTLSDEDLAVLARSGNEEAAKELYYRYHDLVLNVFARVFVCRWMDAEDIFQDAFLKAVRKYLPEKGSFRSFLLLVADSNRKDKLRKTKSQREISLTDETDDIATPDIEIMALEHGISYNQARAKNPPDPALRQFLTPRHREAYNLFYENGEAWEDIADRLNYSSADSARISLRKALRTAKRRTGSQTS